MIRTIILMSLIGTASHAYTDVNIAKTCPAPNRITVTKFFRGPSYVLSAMNQDGKVFRSHTLAYTYKHMPLHPIQLVKEKSFYDAASKTLSCNYLALDRTTITQVDLVNHGDY